MKNITIRSKRCAIHNLDTQYVNLHKEDINYLKYQCEYCDHHNSIRINEAVLQLQQIQCNEPKIVEQQRIENTLQLLMEKAQKFKAYVEQFYEQISHQYQISQRLNKIWPEILNLKKLETLQNEHIDQVCQILVNEDLKKIRLFKEETIHYLQQMSITFQEVEQVLQKSRKIQKQMNQIQKQPQEIQLAKSPPKVVQQKVPQVNKGQDQFINQMKLQQSVIIYAMAFSFDDTKLVVGGGNINHLQENKNLMVITIGDKKEQFLYGHTRRVTAIQYSRYQNFFVSGSLDFTLRLWNETTNDWECVRLLNAHTSTVFGICLDTNENQIFSCSYDTTIIVWEQLLSDWKKQQVLIGHTSSVNTICLSDDNSTLATGSDDTQVILWQKDLDQQWVIKQTIKTEDMSYIYSLCFFKDNTLAIGTHGGQIAIWRLIGQIYKQAYEIKPLCGYVKKIAYNPSEQLLVTKCEHKTIIWKIDNTDYLINIQEYEGEYLGVSVSNFQSLVALFNCDNHMLEIVKYNK